VKIKTIQRRSLGRFFERQTVAQNQSHLVWLDMEMTGLDPEKERILELAIVVTTSDLETVAESPVWVVHQPAIILQGMDEWNTNTHGKSGLTQRSRESTMLDADVEAAAIDFLLPHVPKNASPMCGNSIHQDRRFMVKYMPKLEDYFHYRNLDVSTLKELAARWAPEVKKGFVKKTKHQALADVYESIDELKHYREHFLKLPATAPQTA
jgi:oligoribonuclease